MIQTLLQVAFVLGTPALALWLSKKVSLIKAIGPTVLCYVIGICMGNQGLMPIDAPLSQDVTGGAIVVGIPLLLLSTDFMGWLRQGGKAVLSFALAVVSVSTAAVVGARVFAGQIEDVWKVAGMLVGVYTGGTANLASIGRALQAGDETYFLLNASDVVLSGMYLLFLMTVAKPLLSRVLPATVQTGGGEGAAEPTDATPRGMGLALLVSLAVGGASVGLSLTLTGKMEDVVIIVAITSLGIAASLVPAIRALPGSYALGNYFILVFCVAIGSLTDLGTLMGSGTSIFYMTAMVIGLAVLLHFTLAAVFRIDVDTAIITSTAAVFGPPFVAMIADALGNRQVMLSGMTTGLVGYAVGNYLGLLVAYALHG